MSAAPRPAVPATAFIGFAIAVAGLAIALIATMSALSSQHVTTTRLAATLDSLRAATHATRDSAPVDAWVDRNSTARMNAAVGLLRSRGLANPIEDLRADLVKHPELIPVPGTMGSHHIFFEDMIRVLSDRYAYAYFEDGHEGGEMLLEFEVTNGHIRWRVLTWRRVA